MPALFRGEVFGVAAVGEEGAFRGAPPGSVPFDAAEAVLFQFFFSVAAAPSMLFL
jgi:hypothetical protein